MRETSYCINCMKEIPDGTSVCPHCGFDLQGYTPMTSALPPYTILYGRYLIGRVLGAGGFGITYLALDLVLGRKVCVKEFFLHGTMYRQSTVGSAVSLMTEGETSRHLYQASRDKFEQEARTLAKLEHVPGIVGVLDYFKENNTSYIVMEYLEGSTLKEYVGKHQDGKLEYGLVLEIFHPVIKSLSILHQKGILHRDISPDNLMMLRDGSMKLFDFGGARSENTGGSQSMVVFRKPGYSPIEQYGTEGQGTWSDVYALAATIYFCLTGRVPVESILRVGQEKDPLTTFQALHIRIPAHIEKAIYKGLQVSRKDRYQTVEEFERDLYADPPKQVSTKEKRVNGSKKEEIPGEKRETIAGRSGKGRLVWLVVAILAVLVMVGVIGTKTGLFNGKKQEPDMTAVKERQTETEAETKPGKGTEAETEKQSAAETESETQVLTETETENETQVLTETETESETQILTETETESETQILTETETESETQILTETETETETQAATESESETEAAAEIQTEPQTEAIITLSVKDTAGTYKALTPVELYIESGMYSDDESELYHTQEASVYIIAEGTLLTVDKAAELKDEKWAHTDFYGIKGWMRLEGNLQKVSQNDLSAHKGDMVLLTGNNGVVPIRDAADETAAVKAELPAGSSVTVLNVNNGWTTVLYGENIPGWVNMNEADLFFVNGYYQALEESDGNSLLAYASEESEVLAVVPAGTLLFVDAAWDGYGRTSYNGITGWVSCKDLSFVGDGSAEDIAGVEKPVFSPALQPIDYHNNLLMEDRGAKGELDAGQHGKDPEEFAFGVQEWKRKEIQGIYFLDSLADKPENAVDISAKGNGSVYGWMDDGNNLFIAGNGGVMAPQDCSALFAWYENATEIYLNGNLHTEDVTDFRYMFYHCDNLAYLDLSGMCTDNAKAMIKMFTACKALRSVDLSGFNTENVTSFYAMFNDCQILEALDLTSFRTDKAKNMAMMFRNCYRLREIRWQPQQFTTKAATTTSSMFAYCKDLESVDVSMFDMKNVRKTNRMFIDTERLSYIDVSNWNVQFIEEHTEMFKGSLLENRFGTNGETLFSYYVLDRSDFPDEVFSNYVFLQFDKDGDGLLTADERDQADRIDVDNAGVKNIEGIEYFPHLVSLMCDGNGLTHIDVRANKELQILTINDNAISSIDLTRNEQLTQFYCRNNQLTSLDLSGNPHLTHLDCKNNYLETVDTSNNGELTMNETKPQKK